MTAGAWELLLQIHSNKRRGVGAPAAGYVKEVNLARAWGSCCLLVKFETQRIILFPNIPSKGDKVQPVASHATFYFFNFEPINIVGVFNGAGAEYNPKFDF